MARQKVHKRCIVILADGARFDVFSELLNGNRLPHIAQWMVESGTCQPAVTGFPSTTGPAYLPFLTGALPGTGNVPGIRWLDRKKFDAPGFSMSRHRSYVGMESFLMGRDLDPRVKTIFELEPTACNIFSPVSRGAKGSRNCTRYSRIWYWYYAHLTDRWRLADEASLNKMLKVLRTDCRYLFAVLPGIDEYAHLTHPRHEAVLGRYRFLDEAVGELARFLQKKGEWEDTLLWVVSDHGLSQTHEHFCVNTFLERHGFSTFYYPLILKRKGKSAANMVSGNGMTHVYFKNHGGWGRPTMRCEIEAMAPRFFEELLSQPAIDIVAWREEGETIGVKSRKGEARIRLDGHQIHYEVRGSDPFGYLALPVNLDPSLSLSSTIDSDYPDAPYQLAHIFTSPRAGDLILSAAPGYDLRLKYEAPEHKSSHGSLHKSHMLVPLVCNKRFVRRPARTVDVFPTTCRALNIPIPAHIDGIPLDF